MLESSGGRLNTVAESDSLDILLRLVGRGLGVSVVPEIVGASSRVFGCAVVSLQSAPRREVFLVHRGEATLWAAAKALRRFIIAQARRLVADIIGQS